MSDKRRVDVHLLELVASQDRPIDSETTFENYEWYMCLLVWKIATSFDFPGVFGCAIGYEVGGLLSSYDNDRYGTQVEEPIGWVNIGMPLETVINTKDILMLVKKADHLW